MARLSSALVSSSGLSVLLVLAGCGGESIADAGAPAEDVAVDASLDGPAVDAPPSLDAPALDAPVDATVPLDAPPPRDCSDPGDCTLVGCADDPRCAPGIGVAGDPCTADGDCASRFCLDIGGNRFCSAPCDLDCDGFCLEGACYAPCNDEVPCPAGLVCDDRFVDTTGARGCMPPDFAPTCGNGVIEPIFGGIEPCDGALVPTCAELGFTGGVTRCDACAIDTSGCTARCGDGVVSPSEACEGSPPSDCASLGYAEGTLGCDATCQLDLSGCRDRCGDGMVGPTEACEPSTCRDQGYVSDTVVCTSECVSTGATCAAVCGNGVREPGEECDGSDHGVTCRDLGFPLGALACSPECVLSLGTCRSVAGWTCDGSLYGDGRCDCGCGVRDIDCGTPYRSACAECRGCAIDCSEILPGANERCTVPPVPARWTCAPGLYGDGACDCGCGVIDVDCGSGTVGACEYCTPCDTGEGFPCSALVDPRNLGFCV